MYLLGIADLMANTHTHITERMLGLLEAQVPVPVSAPVEPNLKTRKTSIDMGVTKMTGYEGLDECGLRFILTMQLYSYLCRTMPPARKNQLVVSGSSFLFQIRDQQN
ncbi:DmX-like protein 1 [Cichlidogyrus casuarinus]|uniref:DmX-like protein 1 n=1 Tax=Cichlidogyrus casuarinus TaxID=1844966 RepID=A0ABD2PVL9_9PLAT